jgi:hypothetical protein
MDEGAGDSGLPEHDGLQQLGCDNLIRLGEGQGNGISPALQPWQVFGKFDGPRRLL